MNSISQFSVSSTEGKRFHDAKELFEPYKIRAENERAIITINRQTLTMQSKLKGKYAKAKLKEEKKRKNGSRSFTKFSEMMDDKPTSLGDLGKLIEEENSKDSEVNQKVDVTITSYECDLVEQKI